MNDLLNDWTHIKSYATEATLIAKLANWGLGDHPGVMIVRTPEGRWTALFLKSFLDAQNTNLHYVMKCGFRIVG